MHVVLHLLVLQRGQRAALEQDPVGNADLADVVQRCRLADQLDLVRPVPERRIQRGSRPAHALGVAPGVVVAVLGGARQALEHLEVRGLELLGALGDGALQPAVVLAQLEVQEAGLEQVRHAQQQLVAVYGLGDEVPGAR